MQEPTDVEPVSAYPRTPADLPVDRGFGHLVQSVGPLASSQGYNRQWVDTTIPLGGSPPCRTLRRLARSFFDGIEQRLGGKRFAKESDPTCCSRLISNDLVVQAGHENDWIYEAVRGKLMGQFNTGNVTKLYIHDQTGGLAG